MQTFGGILRAFGWICTLASVAYLGVVAFYLYGFAGPPRLTEAQQAGGFLLAIYAALALPFGVLVLVAGYVIRWFRIGAKSSSSHPGP